MSLRIYLDHAATTPVRPEVRAAMETWLGADGFGNPSSLHADGQRAKRALDAARATVAGALHAAFAEVTFTSGGTEADNAALIGVMLGNRDRGDHLVTTQIEHEAVLRAGEFLERLGIDVTYVAPNRFGRIDPGDIAGAITDRTVLVSVMHANNEVGTIQPVAEIAAIAHQRGALFHTDAVQTFGQLDVHVDTLGLDLVSISAHKIYGPKGVGALYVRDGVSIEPLMHGGTQERERRAGTENVAGIAGFAEAVEMAEAERADAAVRMLALRDRFISQLLADVPGAILNGHAVDRLPGNVNVSFPPFDAEALLLSLDLAGISASSGSACTSGSIEPSHVLEAMGLDEARTRSAIRFTLGRSSTEAEVDQATRIMIATTKRLMAGR